MKRLLITLIFLCTQLGQSQEPLLEIKNVLKKNNKKPNASILVENTDNNSLTVFIVDNETINGYMYKISENTNQLIGKIQSKKLPNWYDNFVGYTVKDSQIRLIFQHVNDSKFGSILFDFKAKRSLIGEYSVKVKNQVYLESFSRGDESFTFYASKKDNNIYVYNFSHSGGTNTLKHSLDFEFKDITNRSTSLYGIMKSTALNSNEVTVGKIDQKEIRSLAKASKKNKMYSSDNGVIFSLDNNMDLTYLMTLNFPDFKPVIKTYNKPIIPEHKKKYPGNSFLFKDHLYQIKSNPEYLKCVITDINSQENLKEFVIEKEKPISFKNSPFMRTGANGDLQNTKQFLRKVYGNPSILVLESDYGFELTLGSSTDITTSAPVNSGFGLQFIDTGTKTNSTFIKCKIDEKFDSITGEIEPNLFDKINSFTKRIKPSAPKLGTFKNEYIYGGYDKSKQTYTVYTFN